MTTLLLHAPALEHTKRGHPENSARLAGILPALERFGLLDDLAIVGPEPATNDQLRRVHTQGLIDFVRMICRQGGGLLDAGDTYATAQSYDLACLAAGSGCLAVDHIMRGHARNGFSVIRPPGHHAEIDHAGGFCLFNNVAVAARHAQFEYGVERVFILDIDVHHGNGTQDIFYEDNTVFFISMHLLAPYFYPGIGTLHEVGTRRGNGYTVNVPFPPGVGDMGYLRIWNEVLVSLVRKFQPQLILVSAGYDAHWQDPLAMARMSLTGYALLARSIVELAEELCEGRLLFVLEGGYQINVLTLGIANTFSALLGQDLIRDPYGINTAPERDISTLLEALSQRDLPN
ncbi:MAG: histone deacetylase [Candidatus Promineifilaceae bacterium]